LNFYNNDVIQFFFTPNNTFKVPQLPSPEYKIKVEDHGRTTQLSSSKKWVYIKPGEIANITHNECPLIISPLMYEENVTDTTLFEIEDNSSIPGIYEYRFNTDYNIHSVNYSIYTNKKSIRFDDLFSTTFIFVRDKMFSLIVNKYSNYNSIDEFAASRFSLNKNLATESTQYIVFKTAP
jgi:hypothetical protein